MSEEQKYIRIAPGEYYVSDQDVLISTVLGSCVAICLYDPIRKVIGMNHIMLSREQSGVECEEDRGKSGICAMELLIADMLKMGAFLQNLRAKAFGGASMFKPYNECFVSYCVGEENVRFAKNFLKTNDIPLVAEDLGGERGRVIYFSWRDFSVRVKTMKKVANSKVICNDDTSWEKLRSRGL